MKIETKKNEVIHNGNRQSMSVKVTPKLFKALTDTIYSNKVGSVVRETMSNAFDAHVAAGKGDVPFDVTAPTELAPVFVVRDYGVGMDHETVVNVYYRLFESTKEDTNEQIGMFGIGANSPFAYTDSFSLHCYDGATKRIYVTSRDEEGGLCFTMAGEVVCDEPKGVEIVIPVRKNDIHRFNNEIAWYAMFYDVAPNIRNIDEYYLDRYKGETILSGDGWKIVKIPGVNGVIARMGCVGYAIARSQFPISEKINDLVRRTYTLILDFEIGELAVSLSRESLSFGDNEPTEVNIIEKLSKVDADFPAVLQAEIDKFETAFDAYKWADRNMRFSIDDVFKYRGFVFQTPWEDYSNLDVADGRAIVHSNQVRFDASTSTIFNYEKPTIVVTNDKAHPKYFAKRLIKYFGGKGDFIVVKYDESRDGINDIIRFLEKFDGLPIVGVDEIASVELDVQHPVKRRSKWYEGEVRGLYECVPVSYFTTVSDAPPAQFTDDDIEDDRIAYKWSYPGNNVFGIPESINALKEYGLPVNRLIFVTRKEALNKIKKSTKWREFDALVKEWLDEADVDELVDVIAHNRLTWNERNILSIIGANPGLSEEPKHVHNLIYHIITPFQPKVQKRVSYYQNILSQAYEKYPMLNHINTSTPYDVLQDYVRLVDNQRFTQKLIA